MGIGDPTDWHSVIVCVSLILNSFIKNPLIEKSIDLRLVLLKWLTSRPYSKIGRHLVFTARCYASAILAMGLCPSVCVCLSVCLSVTSRCSTKTAKRRITKTTPHDTPGTLVFWWQRSPRNSTGVTPYEGAECRWGGSKSATFDE